MDFPYTFFSFLFNQFLHPMHHSPGPWPPFLSHSARADTKFLQQLCDKVPSEQMQRDLPIFFREAGPLFRGAANMTRVGKNDKKRIEKSQTLEMRPSFFDDIYRCRQYCVFFCRTCQNLQQSTRNKCGADLRTTFHFPGQSW